jgi:SAM-dependent methyltransferase
MSSGLDRPDHLDQSERRAPSIDDFLVEHPTRDLSDWRWLWSGDQPFPIRSHRGLLGRLVVGFKRLFRPLVRLPQNDLWERQRIFNLILLEHLERLEIARAEHQRRIEYQEALDATGLHEIMRHNDALFARADQKLDRYRRETRDLLGSLGGALAAVKTAPQGASTEVVARAHEEHGYLELERRYRGTEEEIHERIAAYRPFFRDLPAGSAVLDLGCGRGEALTLLREWGFAGRGVDSSARMVELCHDRGLAAEVGDLFAVLAAVEEGSLGGVVSFHVIEHLPADALDRLVRLAYRTLRPGGVLILETPNPLSVVVAARNFWLDPTHVRPVHPESLKLMYELAGFDPVERLDLRPFAAADRLPEIDLAKLPPEQRPLADQVNRLRDRLDDLLFGCQDFGMVGRKGEKQS